MKTKLNSFRLASGLLMAGAFVLGACTDDNYDLGNIDKTIAVGNEEGFALPGNNSTSELMLDDVLDVSGNDVISVASDGSYYFSRGADEDEVDPALPVVDEIELTRIASEEDYAYDIDSVLDVPDEARRRTTIDLSPTARKIYDFHYNLEEDLPEVLGLTLAQLKAGLDVDLDFNPELKRNLGNLKEITLDLPDFINLNIESRYEDEHSFTFDSEKNILTFNNFTEGGIHLRIQLLGVDFSHGYEPDELGCYLNYTPDSVVVAGTIWLDTKYIEDLLPARRAAGEPPLEHKIITCHSKIDETIYLTSATGKFTPEISLGDGLGEFQIDNLPDFLDDEDAHLVVSNPELRIWIDSNMDIEGLIKEARINAVDARGQQVSIDINTDSLKIDAHTGRERSDTGDSLTSTKTKIVIIDELPANPVKAPHTYYATPRSGKLSDLIYNIPRTVSFDCTAAANPNYEGTIRLGYKDSLTQEAWYKIQPSFEFYAPLAFNNGSVIVYRDSITDWHKDLEDITLSSGATVILTADVCNNVPLDLKMHAGALQLNPAGGWSAMDANLIDVKITDADGNEDFRVKAGTEQQATITPIRITLTQNNSQGFKLIDGLTYSATAMASDDPDKQGITLNSRSQHLQVRNIGVTLRGKIIVDLND